MGGIPPLPVPGPYHPGAGPAYGTAPGALTNNNYLNQQFMNVDMMGQAINSGAYSGGGGSNPMYPGSPLDFAQNYLNPNLANITSQINSTLGSLPPPGTPGAPGAEAASAEGGGLNFGGAAKGVVGGAIVGGAIGSFVPVIGTGVGAVVGGVIGGIAGLFG